MIIVVILIPVTRKDVIALGGEANNVIPEIAAGTGKFTDLEGVCTV